VEKPGASVNAAALLFIGQAAPDITEALFTLSRKRDISYRDAYQDARHARLLSDDRRVCLVPDLPHPPPHPRPKANPLQRG
jgi:hypothetical protein